MHLTKEEAAAALATVRQADVAARVAFRAHRGHYYLWLWGAIWVAMALSAHLRGLAGLKLMPWLAGGGMLASVAISFLQASQVRAPVDKRFLGALASVIGFGALWPLLFQPPPDGKLIFAFIGLICAQAYILAGIWFDIYLLGLGVLLAALLLVGFFFFAPIFWLWIAVCGGGSLIAAGFYVRYFWR